MAPTRRTVLTLKEARQEIGITQQEMADELGVSRPTYKAIEADPSRATIAQAKQICSVLSRSYETIFFGRKDSFTIQDSKAS